MDERTDSGQAARADPALPGARRRQRSTQAAQRQALLLDGGERGTVVGRPRGLLAAMLQRRASCARGDRLRWRRSWPARRRTGDVAFQDQHRDRDASTIETGTGSADGRRSTWPNRRSAMLMRRKAKDGAPFLSRGEFEAGERLRADYHARPASCRASAPTGTPAFASARRGGGGAARPDRRGARRAAAGRARDRRGRAGTVGRADRCLLLPERSGTVERERGWPVRSAKIVLKTALGALAPPLRSAAERGPTGASAILHWGARTTGRASAER